MNFEKLFFQQLQFHSMHIAPTTTKPSIPNTENKNKKEREV
jgi:hypothetical protein